jgi:hypothetical protein
MNPLFTALRDHTRPNDAVTIQDLQKQWSDIMKLVGPRTNSSGQFVIAPAILGALMANSPVFCQQLLGRESTEFHHLVDLAVAKLREPVPAHDIHNRMFNAMAGSPAAQDGEEVSF